MTVLISGGGIGGLALALSLHQIGVDCRVFESVRAPAPLGVGINVLPHAVRELTDLGLLDRLAAIGVATAELAYFNKLGQRIWAEPRGIAAGYNWPQFSVHRGALQMLLFDAARERLGPGRILTGHQLTGWDQDTATVRAHFADGKPDHQGTLLIAADGIHSAARQSLYPQEGPPVWKGVVLWRGTTRAAPYLTGRTMAMIGHEALKFVAYPIEPPGPDGTVLTNWIAERKFAADHVWRREDWNRDGRFDDFLPQFESWRFDWLNVPALVQGAERCFEYPMVDRDPLPRWTFGRVTLLGDAAHAMYPIGSNGASQAILDARVLTREILRLGPVPEALAAYEAERRPATAAIVAANRAQGPDEILEVVESRAPGGFDRIDDVLGTNELEAIAARYKRLAGFDREALNARGPLVPADRTWLG
jgi:hypothetical protein